MLLYAELWHGIYWSSALLLSFCKMKVNCTGWFTKECFKLHYLSTSYAVSRNVTITRCLSSSWQHLSKWLVRFPKHTDQWGCESHGTEPGPALPPLIPGQQPAETPGRLCTSSIFSGGRGSSAIHEWRPCIVFTQEPSSRRTRKRSSVQRESTEFRLRLVTATTAEHIVSYDVNISKTKL